jgi:hypothetical protein
MTIKTDYRPDWKRWHEANFNGELLRIVPPRSKISPATKSLKPDNIGKIPGKKLADGWVGLLGWQMFKATEENLKEWRKDGAGIGLHGRNYPAVDVDIEDKEVVDVIHMLAIDHLGAAPVRYRDNSERILLPYRANGLKPRILSFELNKAKHTVEFKARKQQWVADAVHPSGALYKWREGDGFQHPCDLGPNGLAPITEQHVGRFFDAVIEYATLYGGEIVKDSKKGSGVRDKNAGVRVADEDDETHEKCNAFLDRQEPESVFEGEGKGRDNTATAVANRFYDYGATLATCLDYLAQWNFKCCVPPLTDADLERIAESAMRSRETAIGSQHSSQRSAGFEAVGIEESSPSASKTRNVNPLSANKLMSMHFNPVSYIVPNVIVEGLSIFAGKPKIGKSWLLLHAANAIAEGRTTLGGLKCTEGDVLYCALEDNPRRLQSRMKALFGKSRKWSDEMDGMTNEEISNHPRQWSERLTFVTEMPRLAEGGLKVISDWIEAAECPRLIIIDTLAMVRMPNRKDQSSYDADYSAVVGLRTLAQEHGVAIVLVHHLRKADSDDAFDTVSGTLGLTGAADAILVLKRDTGGGIVLHGRGRDLAELEKAMEFDKPTCTWSIRGDASVVRRSAERNKILAAVKEIGQPATPKEIADEAGLKTDYVRTTLRRLAKDGLVLRGERGKYVPASGGDVG